MGGDLSFPDEWKAREPQLACDVPSLAHPFGLCSVEWCDNEATSRWRVWVGRSKLGVALCDACGLNLGIDRL